MMENDAFEIIRLSLPSKDLEKSIYASQPIYNSGWCLDHGISRRKYSEKLETKTLAKSLLTVRKEGTRTKIQWNQN